MCDAIVVRAKQGKLQEIVKSGIGSTLNARLMGADKCEEGEEDRERQRQIQLVQERERSVDAPEGKSKIDKHFNLSQLKWQRQQRQLQQLLIRNVLFKLTI